MQCLAGLEGNREGKRERERGKGEAERGEFARFARFGKVKHAWLSCFQ